MWNYRIPLFHRRRHRWGNTRRSNRGGWGSWDDCVFPLIIFLGTFIALYGPPGARGDGDAERFPQSRYQSESIADAPNPFSFKNKIDRWQSGRQAKCFFFLFTSDISLVVWIFVAFAKAGLKTGFKPPKKCTSQREISGCPPP